MKKFGLICMAVVLALGTLGVGYAMWSDTVTVYTTVMTGNVNVEIVGQKSNDPPPHGWDDGIPSDVDPTPDDGWFSGSKDPAHGHQPFSYSYWANLGTVNPANWIWVGERYGKNVASCNCTYTPDTLTIDIDNAYPSYGPDVAFIVRNTGTIPAKINSIKLTSVTTPMGTFVKDINVDVDANETAYMVANNGAVVVRHEELGYPPYAWEPGFDDDYAFTFCLTSLGAQPLLNTQLEPGDYLWGDVGLHVAQSAEQSKSYSFTLVYEFCNWNE
jgi:hypothetical protein